MNYKETATDLLIILTIIGVVLGIYTLSAFLINWVTA